MDSPFLQPGFLLTVALAVIGFIVWLVKLERRNAALETEAARMEKEIEKTKTEFCKELEKLKTESEKELEKTQIELKKNIERNAEEIKKHNSNQDIHFNVRVSEQVDKRNEHRFETIEKQLLEINRKLDHLADRE